MVKHQLNVCIAIDTIAIVQPLQRRATKYVLNDYVSDHKSRLIKLQILPLMYILDLNDVIFFVRSLKSPHEGFNIENFISFTSGDTRSVNSHKLRHTRSNNNSSNNFYFNRLPRIWNALPVININLDIKIIKQQLLSYFILNSILGLTMHVVTRSCVAAPGAINILPPLTLTILINL